MQQKDNDREPLLSDASLVSRFHEDAMSYPEKMPMYELVSLLSQKPYAVSTSAGVSHMVLLLGGITISYSSGMKGFFTIKFYERSRKILERKCMNLPEAEALIDALVLRDMMSR